jgi:hypothetical protein
MASEPQMLPQALQLAVVPRSTQFAGSLGLQAKKPGPQVLTWHSNAVPAALRTQAHVEAASAPNETGFEQSMYSLGFRGRARSPMICVVAAVAGPWHRLVALQRVSSLERVSQVAGLSSPTGAGQLAKAGVVGVIAAHVVALHWPLTQVAPVTLLVLVMQALPQAPQLLMSVPVEVSQPSRTVWPGLRRSTFAVPLLHWVSVAPHVTAFWQLDRPASHVTMH